MNIAVNTRLLIRNKLDGIGWFTHETLSRIAVQHPEHTFYFFFDRKYDDQFIYSKNVIPVVAGPQARHPILWYMWFEWTVPRLLKKHNIDLFLSTDGYIPMKSNVKVVDVIHDINFEHFPDNLPYLTSKYYRYYFPKFARSANRLATVSEFSKKDIAEQYKIEEEKIEVVYNGVNELYHEHSEEVNAQTRVKHAFNHPYFVFVGTIQERKNLSRLFQAFDVFKSKYKSNHKLLIVGRKMWWSAEMQKSLDDMQFHNDVILIGRVESTEELAKVVSAAEAMVYVPVFEGFGVPVLEAQRSMTPVITSNNSCLPEISGGAARLCDPFSIEDISEAMNDVVANEKLRKDLIQKGNDNCQRYTWEKTSEKLWSTIEKTIHGEA